MRRIFVVVALAACAPHASTGPSWPKSTAGNDDGGESLAPHQSHEASAAPDRTADEDVKPVAAPTSIAPVIAPSAQVGSTAAPAAGAAAADETIMTEDIVIEEIDE
jgi:hypothetical protein